MRYMFNRALCCVLVLTTGCASYRTVPVQPSDEAITRQVDVLKEWTMGMPLEKVGEEIEWRVSWRLEELHDHDELRYWYVSNPETNAVFGFLFLNGSLLSVIGEKDATAVRNCFTAFSLGGEHWLIYGLRPYVDWIERRAILGDLKELSASGTFRKYEKSSRGANLARRMDRAAGAVLFVIVYAPFFIAYAPFHLFTKSKDEEARAQVEERHAYLQSIELGQVSPPTDVFSPSVVFDVGGVLVHQYNGPSHAYGVRDKKVVMIETPAMFELYERQTAYGEQWYKEDGCASLRNQHFK